MEAVVTYKSNWWGFIGKRMLIAVVAFFIISLFIFVLVNWNSEEIYYYFPPSMTLEEIHNFLRDSGVFQPLTVKYWHWISSFFGEDWGNSILRHSGDYLNYLK